MHFHYFLLFLLPFCQDVLGFRQHHEMGHFSRDQLCKDNPDDEGLTYALFRERVRWFAAYMFCLQNGMELFKLTSNADRDNLMSWLNKNNMENMLHGHINAIWTSSIRRVGSHDIYDFISVPDLKPARFDIETWETGQPNQSDDCLLLSDKLWDNDCTYAPSFVCQVNCNEVRSDLNDI